MSLEVGNPIPVVDLPVRVDGEFTNLNTREIAQGKRIIIFALPGAFTPTCSTFQLPGFEEQYSSFLEKGIDEIYCLSVNDTFVMNAWFTAQGIEKVKALPDGNGAFTRPLGFLVDKTNFGMGMRSWRYSMVVTNGVVENLWVEPGLSDNYDGDPFEVSDADTILDYLQKLQS